MMTTFSFLCELFKFSTISMFIYWQHKASSESSTSLLIGETHSENENSSLSATKAI